MRSKVTVVLLFLNVVLFFYIFYFEKKWRGEQLSLEARRRVLPPEIASLEAISRSSRAGETVRLEKRRTGWWLTAPYEWPANSNAVNRIHNELQFLQHETSFTVADLEKGGQSLADYGLDNPVLTLDLTAAGKSLKLLVGDDTRTGNRLYLYAPDTGRVHVVNRSLAESVGLTLKDLRNESVFTIPVFDIRSLNIQTGAQPNQAGAPANLKVRLRRDQSGRWGFETPILARADKAGVEATINRLSGLVARSFPEAGELERTGLDAPTLRVTFEGNARRESLLIGAAAKDGEYFARFEDKAVIFTTEVPEPLLKVLLSAQEELRDRHVLDFERATVTSITLTTTSGQPEISLQRLEAAGNDGAQWQAVARTDGQAPTTILADTEVVHELLEKIKRLSATKFLSDAPSAADIENYGFTRPIREISLGLTTGGGVTGTEPSTVTLQIGVAPDRPGVAFARMANLPFVYEILPDILEETPASVRHFRQRLLRRLPEGAVITNLALIDLGAEKPIYSQTLNPGDKSWDAALSVEPEAGRKALRAVLDEVASLRAVRFTSENFTADHATTPEGDRPWRYRLDYAVSVAGAPEAPASLFLTERLGGSTLVAGTAEFGGVTFTVTQPLVDALFTLTYRQSQDPGPVPPATPDKPATATLPAAIQP